MRCARCRRPLRLQGDDGGASMIAALLVAALDVVSATAGDASSRLPPAGAHGEVRFTLADGESSGVGRAPFDGGFASAELGFRLFLRPLVDDATPRALQPFLERASFVRARIGGGAITGPWSGVPGTAVADATELHLLVDGEVLLTRQLALAAGTGYALEGASGLGRRRVPFAVEGALRVADLRLGVGVEGGYTREPLDSGASGLGTALALSLRVVFLEHIDVSGRLTVGSDVAARVEVGWYPSRNVGLVAAAGGAGGAGGTQRLDLAVAASWWWTDAVEVTLAWSPSWASSDLASGSFRHQLALAFVVRR